MTVQPLDYITRVPRDLLATSAGRRLLTRDDPMLFAVVYLLHSIRFEDNPPSFSDFHWDLGEYARTTWTSRHTARDCWIAPREAGKSQWLFKILPLWAAAHGHLRFIAAFSDSADQATKHLNSFKAELDHNDLLKRDFPDLCRPLMRGQVKRYVSQSNDLIQQAHGFSFSAKGVDSKSLGLKLGDQRPDLILLDDVEPTESNYSAAEAEKRKRTLLDGIFYLASRASVVLVGTTTMAGSIIDQCRKVHEAQAGSDYDEIVNGLGNEKSLSITSTDNIDYVSSDKVCLSKAKSGTHASDALELIVTPSGHSVPGKPFEAAESILEGVAIGTQIDVSEQTNGQKSIGTNPSDQAHSDTASLHCEDLQRSEHDCGLTERAEAGKSQGKAGFKSIGVFGDTSTNNKCVSDFQSAENIEWHRLHGAPERNNGEQAIVRPTDDVSFYDSLDPELRWIVDEQITVHYYPAILTDDDGTERSWWPEFKPMAELNRVRNTRAFAMNMMNRPVNADAAYWADEDVVIGEGDYGLTIISVDPAVSTKTSSDYTGLVVLSLGRDGLAYVRHAEQVKLVSTALTERVNDLIESFDATAVLVETNQGGHVWSQVFDGIKARYVPIHHTEPKTARAARMLDYYRKHQVRHTRRFAALEDQMFAFPKVAHDDLIDAAGTGIHALLAPSRKPTAKRKRYIA